MASSSPSPSSLPLSCPCINSTEILIEHSNCEQDNGDAGIRFEEVCFPLTFGSNACAAHDVGLDPRCTTTSAKEVLPEFCGEHWCYVDRDACRVTPEQLYRSDMFDDHVDLFYSYSVCNASADSFLSYQTTQSLQNVTIRAAFPIMRDLMHFKRTESGELAQNKGPEYYNDDVPWQGYAIDYFNAVVELSNAAGVEYTFRSVGADELYDPFTGVVHDVHAGLVDVAISTYWITSQRLQMTPYTTPVAVDQVLLFVPQPEVDGGGLQDNVVKIFAPFDPNLWICLWILILLIAFVNIWLSTTRGVHSYLSRRMTGSRWRRAGVVQKATILGGMVLDSTMIFSTYMFGHSVELDWQSTRAQKILMFGFAFLILVSVASYTANLAAFLTVTGVSNYIGSMEEAIFTNAPICAHPTLRKELESVWPDATFVVNEDNPTTFGIIELYEAGKCPVVANSMLDVRQNKDHMKAFCRNHLVSTGSLVLENPIAFPVGERIAGGLSYWLFRAEKLGITFQDYAEQNSPPLECSLKIATSETAELASLSPENFALPIIFCCACVIVAIAVHLLNKPHTSTAMTDVSHNSLASDNLKDAVGRPRATFEAARDASENEDEEQRDTVVTDPMLLFRQNGNGVGGWTDQSMRDHNLMGRRGNDSDVPNNHQSQETTEMKKNLQQVMATQQLMLSMFQEAFKANREGTSVSFADQVPKEEQPGAENGHTKAE
ncbi:receptor ionotropic, delta-2 [Seminavis robusta]|uniref:Receptor ionotropic, delta-2 n=1 Tax=Seminavis robusta TaxID=568900 RepID=A0A9N8EVF7_9STRA|nr:receptor ionotropic, delta-2 [Seminavis robusta]|eukprot:Sro2098_g314380.1 receptor ionotropic, delta-2 (717) ;mRNA; f:6083-8464